MISTPELYMVGAGPGDPELITLKGLKILQRAKVVLYDNLANQELLDYAPAECEKIYVGKQPYGEYTPQEKIHELILEKAIRHGMVVRLKGGDPYIFGRGYEELIFARAHGIATWYVPGITSMQAAGMDDVPLTHRLMSESIWMVTGTKKDGALSEDLLPAIRSRATVVIYMGMKKLQEIADVYQNSGQGDMPALIIQHASLPQKKRALGTAARLPEIAQAAGLTHPAIIFIGKVIGLLAADET